MPPRPPKVDRAQPAAPLALPARRVGGRRLAAPTWSPLHPQASRRPTVLRGETLPPLNLSLPTEAESENFLWRRLAARLPAWASAGASRLEQNWLAEGVRLPWIRTPPPPFHQGVSGRNLTDAQRDCLRVELQRGLLSGALRPATTLRYVTKVFLVPKGDKWRVVFDLRHINSFLRKLTCRYETLKRLRTLAKKGDYCVSLDLTDGFHHIPMAEADQKYLTFEVEGLGAFQWAALPLGLSMSPYVFTKLMKTFVRALRAPLAPTLDPEQQPPWKPPRAPPPATPPTSSYVPPHRRHPTAASPLPSQEPRVLRDLLPRFRELMKVGLRVLPYVDDFAFFFASRAQALEGREYISAVLQLLGLSRNEKKGVWEPTQMLEHLGMGIDTVTGKFFVTPARLSKLQSFAQNLLCTACSDSARRLVPKRRLAAFTGLAQSLYLAIPPARYYLRSLHDVLSTTPGWTGNVRLSKAAVSDLNWFSALPAKWNGRSIWRSPQTAVLHCDASKTAWGAVLNQHLPSRGFWKPNERRQHITFLELRAVRYAVETFATQITGRHVLLREDNQAVCAILSTLTSRSPQLMRELRRLWYLLDTLDVTLSPKYIRSADNWWADELSRVADRGDWRLHPALFQQLSRDWGPFTVDRFASMANAQLPRYNSAWLDPQTEGLDAFAQSNWADESNYCNPPWELLDRVAQMLDETGAAATVVAPCWPAQPWYQRLQELSSETLFLPASRSLFCPEQQLASGFDAQPSWSAVCFRILARPPGGR